MDHPGFCAGRDLPPEVRGHLRRRAAAAEKQAAEAAEVSVRTAGKWVARWCSEAIGGLLDRSSAPMLVANRSDERTVEVIAALRRLRFTGPGDLGGARRW
jgi:hypothetical protein